MAEQIRLVKTVYGKITYPNVIDTEFRQLISPPTEVTASVVTVNEFFSYYNDLFFEIPTEGEFNSHLELIRRSTEFVGVTQNSGEIDALLDEINQLRLENITLQKEIDDLIASQ
jgi:hypothetical protein